MEKINSLNVIKDVQSYLKSECPELKRFDFPVLGAIAIGLVRIIGKGGKAELYLDDRVDKRYMTMWRNDIGSIILNDIKCGTFDGYYEFDMNGKVGLLRRVTDDIEKLVSDCGLGIVHHGDFSYVFIRFRSADGSYAFDLGKYDYVPEAQENDADDSDDVVEEPAAPQDECECIELF